MIFQLIASDIIFSELFADSCPRSGSIGTEWKKQLPEVLFETVVTNFYFLFQFLFGIQVIMGSEGHEAKT